MTKHLLTQTLSLLLIYISSVAIGQTTTSQDKRQEPSHISKDWKELDASEYMVKYPTTWELNQSGEMGTSFILFAALESGTDQFKENVNLIVQDLTGYTLDLKGFADLSLGQIKTMVTNSKLIENTYVKNGNSEYQKVMYTGDQGIFHLQYEQYYWVEHNKAYVLTFTAEQDKFDAYRQIGEGILESFVVKD